MCLPCFRCSHTQSSHPTLAHQAAQNPGFTHLPILPSPSHSCSPQPAPSSVHPVVNVAGLPQHLVAVRAAGQQDHIRNRGRIRSQGRHPNGHTVKHFAVGDNVLLVPQKCGHAGGATIDPQSIVCRVVGTRRPGGHLKYKLRCNSGLLDGMFFRSQLRPAPRQSAETLTFTGVETEGVRVVSLAAAKTEQRVGGAAAAPCRCRGMCSKRCKRCKCKGGCSRACGCNGFCNGSK